MSNANDIQVNSPTGVPDSAPAPTPKRKVVVAPIVQGQESLNLFVAIIAAVLSIAAHVVIFFLLLGLNIGAADAGAGEIKAEAVMDDGAKEPEKDLTNTDTGFDSLEKADFNVNRLEEVSVPGIVNPTESVGIESAPETTATNLSAPPGIGGGQGGGIVDPTQSGTANAFGSIGGMTGIATAGGFAGRSASSRDQRVKEGGGNARSEAAVAKGLLWFARHQSSDGRWSLNEFNRHAHEQPTPSDRAITCNCSGMATRNDDVSATAFALLPYLAAGITHRPSTIKQQVDYQKTVGKGLDFILSKQGRNGYYGGGMYSHGLTTIAICEAYGMTSDPKLKLSAQKAIGYIVASQDDKGGGWRYEPRTPGDTSVVGWQLMALKSGQMAGLSVPSQTIKLAERFLDSVETSKKGTYGYVPGESAGRPAMTAAALLCRMYLGVNPRNKNLISGIEYLKSEPPHKQINNLYYLYYASQVMHHFGGDAWKLWNAGIDGNPGIREIILARMDNGTNPKTSHQSGSWAPTSEGHISEGGRIMATSLSLLTLEIYYRHLPLYGRDDMGMMKEEK